jgi:hypothetical protein
MFSHDMGPWEKSSMFKSYDEAGVYLGILDTLFMVCYSVGLFFSGWIGERVEVSDSSILVYSNKVHILKCSVYKNIQPRKIVLSLGQTTKSPF